MPAYQVVKPNAGCSAFQGWVPPMDFFVGWCLAEAQEGWTARQISNALPQDLLGRKIYPDWITELQGLDLIDEVGQVLQDGLVLSCASGLLWQYLGGARAAAWSCKLDGKPPREWFAPLWSIQPPTAEELSAYQAL